MAGCMGRQKKGGGQRKERRQEEKKEEMMTQEGGGEFCWEMYCIFLFIRHALISEGMKIILSSSGTVGMGVAVRLTMALYSLL